MLDLRKLLLMIKEQKQMNANMSLEFDCEIDTDDPKPLVSVINYIINLLGSLTDSAIEISLNAHRGGSMLSFAIHTEKTDMEDLPQKLVESLAVYNGSVELVRETGKYVQVIVTFS